MTDWKRVEAGSDFPNEKTQPNSYQKLQHHHQELLNLFQAREMKVHALQEDLRASQNKYQALKLGTTVMQQNLEACQDDLFRLQPLVPISDAEVISHYEDLCQQISDWTDHEIDKLPRARYSMSLSLMHFSSGSPKKAEPLLKKYPEAREYFIIHTIHQRLQAVLLNEGILLCGLSERNTTMLQETELEMKALKPPREPETIDNWRSETLRALSNTTKLMENRQKLLLNFTRGLAEVLSPMLPAVLMNHQWHLNLQDQVVKPAFRLAIECQISPTSYRFGWTPLCDPHLSFGLVGQDILRECKVIDVFSGKRLRADKAVIPNESGMIGQPIMMLEPCLYKVNRDGNTRKMLRQEAWLFEPVQ
ncbi:hypothetical protein MMC13_000245 [Lambiella insularis]|nr:hypothetical protein [Lambiella insularis]